jgi:hypothetical protein
MNFLRFHFVAALVIVTTSCTAPSASKPAIVHTNHQTDNASETPAEKLVKAIDRTPERLSSWTAIEPDAAALGISTPPSPESWQQLLTASLSLHASPSTQLFFFTSGIHFGDAYEEAAYRTYKSGARNIWMRMACVDREIAKWREESWVAESVLNLAQEILQVCGTCRKRLNGAERICWTGLIR